jgi:hypothetical protein
MLNKDQAELKSNREEYKERAQHKITANRPVYKIQKNKEPKKIENYLDTVLPDDSDTQFQAYGNPRFKENSSSKKNKMISETTMDRSSSFGKDDYSYPLMSMGEGSLMLANPHFINQ